MYFSKTTSKSTKSELQKNASHAKNKLNPARNENWPQKVTCTLFLYQSLCITNHLMTGPFGKSEFCLPRISVFLETKSRDTLRFDSLFPSGSVIKYMCFNCYGNEIALTHLRYRDTYCLQTSLLIFIFCQPQKKLILYFDSQ